MCNSTPPEPGPQATIGGREGKREQQSNSEELLEWVFYVDSVYST